MYCRFFVHPLLYRNSRVFRRVPVHRVCVYRAYSRTLPVPVVSGDPAGTRLPNLQNIAGVPIPPPGGRGDNHVSDRFRKHAAVITYPSTRPRTSKRPRVRFYFYLVFSAIASGSKHGKRVQGLPKTRDGILGAAANVRIRRDARIYRCIAHVTTGGGGV